MVPHGRPRVPDTTPPTRLHPELHPAPSPGPRGPHRAHSCLTLKGRCVRDARALLGTTMASSPQAPLHGPRGLRGHSSHRECLGRDRPHLWTGQEPATGVFSKLHRPDRRTTGAARQTAPHRWQALLWDPVGVQLASPGHPLPGRAENSGSRPQRHRTKKGCGNQRTWASLAPDAHGRQHTAWVPSTISVSLRGAPPGHWLDGLEAASSSSPPGPESRCKCRLPPSQVWETRTAQHIKCKDIAACQAGGPGLPQGRTHWQACGPHRGFTSILYAGSSQAGRLQGQRKGQRSRAAFDTLPSRLLVLNTCPHGFLIPQ